MTKAMRSTFAWGGALLAAALGGCRGVPTEPDTLAPGEKTGTLRVLLGSDTPADLVDPRIEAVWLRVEKVEARHRSKEWIDVSHDRKDIDLLKSVDGGQPGAVGRGSDLDPGEIIGESKVWTGRYDRLRIVLADAWVVADGQERDLEFVGDLDPLAPLEMRLTLDDAFAVETDSETSVRVVLGLGDELLEKANGNWRLDASTWLDVDISGSALHPE